MMTACQFYQAARRTSVCTLHMQARPAGQPLITVSNHVAAMDDPLLLAALTPFRRCFAQSSGFDDPPAACWQPLHSYKPVARATLSWEPAMTAEGPLVQCV
jgi:hypothetical protein